MRPRKPSLQTVRTLLNGKPTLATWLSVGVGVLLAVGWLAAQYTAGTATKPPVKPTANHGFGEGGFPSGSPQTAKPERPAPDVPYAIVRLADGDTFTIGEGDFTWRIRLFGVDCPETKQAHGKDAAAFTAARVEGKKVTVAVKDVDRYGRVVAEVFLPDGTSLNRDLVRHGWAWWYKQYSPKDKELGELEAAARTARIGLWADPAPQAPWDFRRKTSKED